jgi:hypothetical protein
MEKLMPEFALSKIPSNVCMQPRGRRSEFARSNHAAAIELSSLSITAANPQPSDIHNLFVSEFPCRHGG